MAFLEQLPLNLSNLVLISLVVCAGTTLQVATGIGLGLLAGPILILNLESETAIFIAIILNLLVSLTLLPQEKGDICWPPLRMLLFGTLVGIPLGWLTLRHIDATSLKLLTGVVVLVAAVQLLISHRRDSGGAEHIVPLRTLLGGGVSGFMSGCLAMPGPVAMWTLLQQRLAPSLARATVRALFVFSYSAALMIHVGLGGIPTAGWEIVGVLIPALATGVVLGVVVKRKVKESSLHAVLRLLLLAMGLSLFWKGISDVITI